MTKVALQLTVTTILMILAQVIVFNNVCLFNVAVPFVFIYIFLRLPVTLHMNWVLTIGFLVGLTVDIFSNSQGMNTLTSTITVALRKPVLRLYFPREEDLTDPLPSIKSIGLAPYSKYALTVSFIYCSLIFIIEAFSFFNFLSTLLHIICSTLLTAALLIGIDSLISSKREKRL